MNEYYTKNILFLLFVDVWIHFELQFGIGLLLLSIKDQIEDQKDDKRQEKPA